MSKLAQNRFKADDILIPIFLGILISFGLYLRIGGLSEWYPSWEEGFHLFNVFQDSLLDVLSYNMHSDVHGPFYFLILHSFLGLGLDIMGLRFASILPGILLVLTFYIIGRNVSGRGAGIFMAVIACFSYPLVELSQVFRVYSMMLLFTSMATCCMLHFERSGYSRYLFAYFICSILALFTNPSAFIPFCTVGAIWLFRITLHRTILTTPYIWIFAHIAIGCIFAYYTYNNLS